MAYNYLELTNAVLRRMNEVELTSSTFASCKGFHSQVKDSINAALRDIYQSGVEWPFNHQTETQVLTPGTVRYALPSDCREVDGESFRIAPDDALEVGEAKSLTLITYDHYLQNYINEEYKIASEGNLPDSVFLDNQAQFGVVACPNKAYTAVFEYYSNPEDLSAYNDVPTVPEAWKWVIIAGGEYWAHVFRDNPESGALAKKLFDDGRKDMRRLLVNKNPTMRSTVVKRATR